MFITFESTEEGLGKTTQAKMLVDALNAMGIEAIYTKEPSGTIREMLLDKTVELTERQELLLFMADRAGNIEKVVKPALARGIVVVCDRYYDSTVAYQGFGRGHSMKMIQQLHLYSTGHFMPDLTFVLDGQSFKELEQGDRFESLDEQFRDRVKAGIRYILSTNRHRCRLINANNSIENVHAFILNDTLKALGLQHR